jgi:hypothetical protein
VGGSIFLILFHNKLKVENISYIATLSALGSAYLVIFYFKMGELNETSKQALGSWKRNGGLRLLTLPQDKKLLRRYLSSLQHLKFELRGFGYFRKATSLRIIGKLIFYTTKSLMLLQKFL